MRNEERANLRLRNMAILFVRNTNNVDIRKLEKLYYFADLEAFREDGFTISGLRYFACETGPRPKIEGEFLYKKMDFSAFLGLTEKNYFETTENFCPDKFSAYEIEILEKISRRYKDATGKWLSELSHRAGEPWARTIALTGPETEIDFNKIEEAEFGPDGACSRRKSREDSAAHLAALDNFAKSLSSEAGV